MYGVTSSSIELQVPYWFWIRNMCDYLLRSLLTICKWQKRSIIAAWLQFLAINMILKHESLMNECLYALGFSFKKTLKRQNTIEKFCAKRSAYKNSAYTLSWRWSDARSFTFKILSLYSPPFTSSHGDTMEKTLWKSICLKSHFWPHRFPQKNYLLSSYLMRWKAKRNVCELFKMKILY